MSVNLTPISDDELRARLQAAATGKPPPAHDFFAQFEYNLDRKKGDHLKAYNNIISLLQHLSHLDLQAYDRIHKGVPFYFGAIAAFILHNFEDAVYLFDAALCEDLKNSPGERTPPLLFMALDADNPAQAARQLTKIAEEKLTEFVNLYNLLPGAHAITVQDVKEKFLEHAISDRVEWRTQATAWISFLLEWNHRYALHTIRRQFGTWEPFYMHLFKGCVLFESLIKANPSETVPQDTLGAILKHNAYIQQKLGITKEIKTAGFTFPDLLANLLGPGCDLPTSVEFVVRLRNVIGHNLGWDVAISPEQYIQMVTAISCVCLHTISTLY